jgi:hypothetical protein
VLALLVVGAGVLAGYGYRPGRSTILWCLVVIASFAVLYM